MFMSALIWIVSLFSPVDAHRLKIAAIEYRYNTEIGRAIQECRREMTRLKRRIAWLEKRFPDYLREQAVTLLEQRIADIEAQKDARINELLTNRRTALQDAAVDYAQIL